MNIWDEIIKQSSDENKDADNIPYGIGEGSRCSHCGEAGFIYNGLLVLICPSCGWNYCGGFT
ncbi:MAG: hypothetical protein KA449_00740 [Pelolinea sp.]|nr:hypothetical protein [Pelolinea sp.]